MNKIVSSHRNTGLNYKTVSVLIGIKMRFGRDKTEKAKKKNTNNSVGVSQIVVLYAAKLCSRAGGFRCRGGVCYTTPSTAYCL